jgi:hypothetical protein
MNYREIRDPIETVISRLYVMQFNPEEAIIDAIDQKYGSIHWDILYLKRRGLNKKKIMKILHIGDVSYEKALSVLKHYGQWKNYIKKETKIYAETKANNKEAQ